MAGAAQRGASAGQLQPSGVLQVNCKWRFGTRAKLNSGDRALRQAARWSCGCCARDDDPDAEGRMVRGPGGCETPTRYSTAFGK
jgi:hypothetical protein